MGKLNSDFVRPPAFSILQKPMISIYIQERKITTGKIICWCLLMLFLGAILTFSVYYLLAGRTTLSNKYLKLDPDFYQSGFWKTRIFTVHVYEQGRLFAAGAIVCALGGITFCYKMLRARINLAALPFSINLNEKTLFFNLLCLVTTVAFWSNGKNSALPAYDEAFSAYRIASMHPFQIISYYVLPNNHLLFNFLNATIFHFANDKVVTGRFISLLAYIGVTFTIFRAMTLVFRNQVTAFVFTLATISQFFVWGFSFQARGYELYLLAELGLLVCTFDYLLTKNKRVLPLMVLCSTVGFFCLPSFLYFDGAVILLLAGHQIVTRKIDWAIWRNLGLSAVFTFFLYLPVLCFSGLEAITNNSYVAPMGAYKTTGDFAQWMFPYLGQYINHIFGDAANTMSNISLCLLLLPLTLFIGKQYRLKTMLGCFYLLQWGLFLGMVLFMKRLPFERNLIGHYLVSVAFGLIAIYYLLNWFLGSWLITKRISMIAFCGSTFLFFNNMHSVFLKNLLYEYDVNPLYQFLDQKLSVIPTGSTIAFSDESFLCYCICKARGYRVSLTPNGHEAYLVVHKNEELASPVPKKYEVLDEAESYLIFKNYEPDPL